MATRLCKNYYRLGITTSKLNAFHLLPDILKKYGKATKISPRRTSYYMSTKNEVEKYNGGTSYWIQGFEMNSKKELFVHVYWQGDSTDGDEYIPFYQDPYDTISIPPTKPVNLGNRYYVGRQGLSLRADEIWEAIKGLNF